MFNVLVFHTESLKSQMNQIYLIYHCSSLSAVRTTSPISPTGTYKPTVRAPFWSSRVTTPVIPSGWATRRPPLCGTMTLYAPIGGVPTRPWKGPRSRPTCCRPPTGMNFSAGAEAAVGGNLQVRRPRGERKKVFSDFISAHSLSPRWHAQCHINRTWEFYFIFFFPKHVSGCVAQGEGTVGALIVLQMSLTIQMLELAQTGHSREQSVLLLTFFFFFLKTRVYTVCMTDVTSVFLFERMLVMVCVCVCALVMIPCFTASTFVDLLSADLGSSSCTVHNSWHFWIKAWYFYYYYFFSFFFKKKMCCYICLSVHFSICACLPSGI